MTAQANAPTSFSRNLQRQRTAHGWSFRQAAAASGLSHMTIRRAETGARTSVFDAAKLAAAYGTTVDALLAEPAS